MSGPRRTKEVPPPTPRPPSSVLPIVLGAALLIVAAAVAVLVAGPGGSPVAPSPTGRGASTPPPATESAGSASSAPVTPSPGAVAVTGASLPLFDAAIVDPALGMSAPLVTGADFDGTPVALRADGRPKIVLFLAHWCSHCQAEVPIVQRWLNDTGMPADVDLLSVATAINPNRPNYPPDAWLTREGWTVPVVVDGQNLVAQAYGLSAFPYWVLIDRDGRVAGRLTGELPVAEIEAIIKRLTAT